MNPKAPHPMEPPSLNEILTIGDNLESNDRLIQGIVKKSGEHDDGRIWAQVWYNDVRASYVGFVEWCESRWILSDPTFEELHHAWKSVIEKMIVFSGDHGISSRPTTAGHP